MIANISEGVGVAKLQSIVKTAPPHLLTRCFEAALRRPDHNDIISRYAWRGHERKRNLLARQRPSVGGFARSQHTVRAATAWKKHREARTRCTWSSLQSAFKAGEYAQ